MQILTGIRNVKYGERDREYTYRTLLVQYTFSLRYPSENEKLFDSRTQAKKLACYPAHILKIHSIKSVFLKYVRDTRIELVPQPWEGRILPLKQSHTLYQNSGTKIACYSILEVLPLN